MTSLSEYEAAYALGEKVLEMADRLRPIVKIVPGSKAAYRFSIDDDEFRLTLEVVNDGKSG